MKQKFESIDDRKTWRKAVAHLKKRDKVIAKIIKKVKVKEIELETDFYGSIIRNFVYQQISGSAAKSILKKFMALYKGKLPKPRQFLKTDIKKLRGAGLSPQKVSYINDFCDRIEKGKLELRVLEELDNEEVIRILDEVRGIGRWTAEMFLMFSLGRPDVLPVDDLGVKNAVKKAYKLRQMPSPKKFEELKKKWHPYSSVATIYLWRSVD